MKDFYLEIKHIDKQTGARYGILHTPHGASWDISYGEDIIS